MTELTNNLNLKKGDIITMIEICPISQGAGTPNHKFIDTTLKHKFLIKKVNIKTYICIYTEGTRWGRAFGWDKMETLPDEVKYYI